MLQRNFTRRSNGWVDAPIKPGTLRTIYWKKPATVQAANPPIDKPPVYADYRVVSVTDETAEIKQIVLQPLNEGVGDWTAGAHVRVSLPNGEDRAYSMMKLPQLAPGQIALGILREAESTGGSAFMHSLKAGDSVSLSGPINRFELSDHRNILLLAGGIGVTPLLSMAVELSSLDANWTLHYAGRAESYLAFVPLLQSICGNHLQLHFDDRQSALDIPSLLGSALAGTHVYVCGPSGMIDVVREQINELGWDSDRLHYELFTNSVADSDDGSEDRAFDVEIHATGQVVHVPADKTIIEALEQAGLDPLYDCQRGDCGICQCTVVDGIPQHRDLILTDAEKASNKVMQICVSRSQTPKLVIEL